MIEKTLRKQALLTIFCFFSYSFLFGQSSLHCLEEGAWLPVYEVRGNAPYCFTGDELIKSKKEKLTMLSSESFGTGLLEVKIIENKRGGVVREGEALRFVKHSGWFEFTARVTAIEGVQDAYCVMRFDRFGEASFVCRRIGDLEAGESRVVSILTQVDYEMPEQMHFYSGTEEIRTNLVPDNYKYEYGNFLLAAN